MSWRAIIEADLKTQISGDELAAVREAALAENQEDPVQPTITQVTKEVRGFVAACTQNVLDANPLFVPDELIGHAVAIIVPRLMGRVAGLAIDKDDTRKNALNTAMGVMRSVAKCEFVIVQTEDPTEEETVGTPPGNWNSRTRFPMRTDATNANDE